MQVTSARPERLQRLCLFDPRASTAAMTHASAPADGSAVDFALGDLNCVTLTCVCGFQNLPLTRRVSLVSRISNSRRARALTPPPSSPQEARGGSGDAGVRPRQ